MAVETVETTQIVAFAVLLTSIAVCAVATTQVRANFITGTLVIIMSVEGDLT
jgi:hypothetical protein